MKASHLCQLKYCTFPGSPCSYCRRAPSNCPPEFQPPSSQSFQPSRMAAALSYPPALRRGKLKCPTKNYSCELSALAPSHLRKSVSSPNLLHHLFPWWREARLRLLLIPFHHFP